MKTNFFISSRLGAVYRGFSALTSVASCSSYFMKTTPGPRAHRRAEIIENIEHQKDAQRNSAQKDVLNSSPSFFPDHFVKKHCFPKSVFPAFNQALTGLYSVQDLVAESKTKQKRFVRCPCT